MVFLVALLTWLSAPISYLSGGQVGHYKLVTSALYVDPFYQTDWAFVLNNNGFWCIIYRYHPHARHPRGTCRLIVPDHPLSDFLEAE